MRVQRRHQTQFALTATALVLVGCHQSQPRSANDKVHIKAPFTDVRIGESGGAKVNAPFTRVETTRYKESAIREPSTVVK